MRALIGAVLVLEAVQGRAENQAQRLVVLGVGTEDVFAGARRGLRADDGPAGISRPTGSALGRSKAIDAEVGIRIGPHVEVIAPFGDEANRPGCASPA